ncbi:endonuclease NucS [Halospeciosus flavus]|uniref:Endonuclease NucS n=1 Tax=Halospeciosus flavus TaxID=3032283 RepID=A0ABD5Z5I6_9EURY|nr:endonuclease NucS [Halospeciosus flavus]
MTDVPDAARTLVDPMPTAAADLLDEARETGAVVALFGRCTVDYDGRASGHLGPGDRHVLCKPDGTLLVHDPEGHQPEAWHAAGAEREATVDGTDTLVLRSERDDGTLVVRFEALAHVAAHTVESTGETEVTGTEEDLRQRVLDDPSLVEAGFRPLAVERETDAGPVDVYGEDAEGRTVAVELKRRRVGPDAAGQLERYVDALERDLHADAEVRGILVAPSVTDRCRQTLAAAGLEFVSLTP